MKAGRIFCFQPSYTANPRSRHCYQCAQASTLGLDRFITANWWRGDFMAWTHKGSRHERGYDYQWVKRRAEVLKRDAYLCQPCLSKGRPTPATEVDHIDPKAQDGSDDYENLQSICTPCHKAKTQAETSRKTRFGADGWPI